jgi:cytochrome P450
LCRPNRFLSVDGKKLVKYEQMVPFGVGKRICMGDSLARCELFIFFVLLLQRLNIGFDPAAPTRPDKSRFTMGATAMPKPFHVTVKARK